MDLLHLPGTANVSISRLGTIVKKKTPEHGDYRNVHIICFASKRQGFGPEPKKEKTRTSKTSKERKQRKVVPVQPMKNTGQAPGLGKETQSQPGNILSDGQFVDRLEAVKRSALEQKKLEEKKLTQGIDYDAPFESEKSTIGLGTKVGVGIAVVVFGLVFAFGDFLPSGSLNSSEDIQVAEKKLTAEEKATLQTRLEQYETTLKTSPDDLSALEGAAVTSADLGEYKQASLLLEKLTKQRPEDYEAYRLLGEVKYELKDYDSSASAYKSSLSASSELNFEALRGLTNALLAAKKPDEAVQVLLSSAQQLNDVVETNSDMDKEPAKVDPIQVQLLLGKAYSDWGHVSDAVSVYDLLISKHPNDFRGYLAKGIILKENGKVGDAERMFIQARFFATDKAKALVDQYSRK